MGMIKLPNNTLSFFKDNYEEIFASGSLAEGDWSNVCSKKVCEITKINNAVMTNSNGAGLHAVLKILQEKYDKKTIFLQDNTMYGVKTIALTSGLKLIGYVECNLSNMLMPTKNDVENFIKLIDEPEKSVFMLTHIGGWINPEIEEIVAICSEAKIDIVEDCAHSIGSTLNDMHSGSFGIAGVYSFYATKALPAGEGGCVVTNNDELGNLVQKFSIYDRFDQIEPMGLNIRMSEINALLCYAILKEMDHVLQNKHNIAEKYSKICDEVGLTYIQPKTDAYFSNLYKYIIYSDVDKIYNKFKDFQNRTSPVYDYSLSLEDTAITKGHLCLPIWYGLEDEIIESTIEEIKKTFNG